MSSSTMTSSSSSGNGTPPSKPEGGKPDAGMFNNWRPRSKSDSVKKEKLFSRGFGNVVFEKTSTKPRFHSCLKAPDPCEEAGEDDVFDTEQRLPLPAHVPASTTVVKSPSRSDLIAKHQERKSQRASQPSNDKALSESLAKLDEETRGGGSVVVTSRPVDRMMNIFRGRASTSVTAEYKKKMQQKNYEATMKDLKGDASPSLKTSKSGTGVERQGSLEPELRKRTASLSTPHRASDVHINPNQAAILFRDARGLPATNPFVEKMEQDNTLEDLRNDKQIFVKFFHFHKCYDLIPTSAKLVVFDTELLVKKAFFALVYNGVRAAPLWDCKKQKFVGMLTITDFIRILQMYYKSPTVEIEELEGHKLATWRQVLNKNDVRELISIGPDASLLEAIKTLIDNKIHRLPVIDPDTGNVLYILTHKRLLKFLFLYVHDLPRPPYFDLSIEELNIGTYNDIETARHSTPIIEALRKFVNRRISALPIVDENDKLIDIYAKFDVINLAAEKTYSNLDVTLKEANEHRNEWFEGVHNCKASDSLSRVMELIVKAEVHRLVVVSEDEKVVGVISLSDILSYLVHRPSREAEEMTNKTVQDAAAKSSESTDKSEEASESDTEQQSVPPSSCDEDIAAPQEVAAVE